MTLPERRWRDGIVTSVVPGAANLAHVWAHFDRAAPRVVRLGLRAGVWALTWLPLLLEGRPLHRLPRPLRERYLARAPRPLALLLKWLGCAARFA